MKNLIFAAALICLFCFTSCTNNSNEEKPTYATNPLNPYRDSVIIKNHDAKECLYLALKEINIVADSLFSMKLKESNFIKILGSEDVSSKESDLVWDRCYNETQTVKAAAIKGVWNKFIEENK